MIMKVLPFMLPIFSFGFPAALVVYWFVSNLFRVGQQFFITHQVYGKHDAELDIVRPKAEEKKPASQTAKAGSGTKIGTARRSPRAAQSCVRCAAEEAEEAHAAGQAGRETFDP